VKAPNGCYGLYVDLDRSLIPDDYCCGSPYGVWTKVCWYEVLGPVE
jgi:hypothetical protein